MRYDLCADHADALRVPDGLGPAGPAAPLAAARLLAPSPASPAPLPCPVTTARRRRPPVGARRRRRRASPSRWSGSPGRRSRSSWRPPAAPSTRSTTCRSRWSLVAAARPVGRAARRPAAAPPGSRATAWSPTSACGLDGARPLVGRRPRRRPPARRAARSCTGRCSTCSTRRSPTSRSPARELTDRADGADRGRPARPHRRRRRADRRGDLLPGPAPAAPSASGACRRGRHRPSPPWCSALSHFQLLQLPALVLFGAVAGVPGPPLRPARARRSRPTWRFNMVTRDRPASTSAVTGAASCRRDGTDRAAMADAAEPRGRARRRRPRPTSPRAESSSRRRRPRARRRRRPPGARPRRWIGARRRRSACVHLRVRCSSSPDLLFANTTPAGGDMGAHVWGPAYLRDHLLPHWRLTGWTPDWYAGFPAFQFYMVLPALLIVLLDVVLPYGVAFKLVTVLGVLALPVAAYVIGRLIRLPFPGPPLLAVATVPFLFDRTWTIYGGNIASTLAGEYTFSISLVAGAAVLRRARPRPRDRPPPRPGRRAARARRPVPRHPRVLRRGRRRRARAAAARPARGSCFAAPVLVHRAACSPPSGRCRSCSGAAYLNDMGWEKLDGLPGGAAARRPRAGCSCWRSSASCCRSRSGSGSARSSAVARRSLFGARASWLDAAAPVHSGTPACCPSTTCPLPARGRRRVGGGAVDRGASSTRRIEWRRRLAERVGAVAGRASRPSSSWPCRCASLPGGHDAQPTATLPLARSSTTTDDSFVDSWAKWNYTGYERKAAYPEYHGHRRPRWQDVGRDRRLRPGHLGVRRATSTATARRWR